MGVYHPLKNAVFEHLYRRLRNFAPNYHQVTMQDTVRHYIKNRSADRGVTLGLISDQTPNLRADTEWFDFFGRKTAFIDGSEKLAMRFHIPIYFVHVERVKAGHIAVRFDEIYDGVEEVEPNEITRRYVVALESMIREHPELWLWSHKRWKHTPEKQLQRFGKMTTSGER
jgi:KDO2-lipid IV(A) lauroyltransferase